MKIKFYNAKIMTSSEEDILDNACLVVNNDKIEHIGDNVEGNFDRVIDAKGNLIMAGFINCHTHLAMTLLKGIGEDTGLEEWLFEHIIPNEMTLTPSDVYYGTYLAVAEMLKSGITTYCDSYFYPDEVIKVTEKSGIRGVISLGLCPTQGGKITEKELEKYYLKYNKKYPNVHFNFWCHSTYTVEEPDFIKITELARKYGEINVTHASETLTEVGNCTQKHNGLTPIMLLEKYGFFDQKAMIAHGVHLDLVDYDILSGYGVSVCTNPSSNLKLGSGIAPLSALLKNNINVCIGTDGSSSNNRLDMFREMYLASVLQKEELRDGKAIPCATAIKMATENGAKALNFDNLGKLKEGYLADLIMLDLNSIDFCSSRDIKSAVVYSSGTEDVKLTMVNGKILYEDGKFNIGEDIETIKSKCSQIIKKFK